MVRRKYSKEFLEPIVKESISYAEVIRRMGMRPAGGTQALIKKRVAEYGIDTSHFLGRRVNCGAAHKGGRKSRPLKSILVRGSTFSRSHLKRRLLDDGIKSNKCELCGQSGEWMGKMLIMVIDHVNGDGCDNRLSNLRMLCPNCNSQQSTFCRQKA